MPDQGLNSADVAWTAGVSCCNLPALTHKQLASLVYSQACTVCHACMVLLLAEDSDSFCLCPREKGRDYSPFFLFLEKWTGPCLPSTYQTGLPTYLQ